MDVREAQWEDLALPRHQRENPKPPVPQAKRPEALPASYLTHELRAPVTAIRLGIEMLQEQLHNRLSKDEKQMLDVTAKNTARLERLVTDILDYSKAIAGQLQLQRAPCDPRLLAAEAVDGMRAVALAAGVKLVREEGEPLPRVSAEAGRAVQVLVNLISNAVKYTPSRGTVTVSCSRGKFEHEGTVVFKVRDTGRGIPAQDIDKIFSLFTMASNVKPSEGTGLGLTLARLMVERHGGRIWAESWRGVGATFYFTIPIAAEDLLRRVPVYPKPVEYSGLLVRFARGFNSFMSLFV